MEDRTADVADEGEGTTSAGADAPDHGAFRAVRALVELRRRSLRFVDMRGRLAEDLLSAYESVDFNGPIVGPGGVGSAERLSVEPGRSGRIGAVDWNQVTYEDPAAADLDAFSREAMVFFRRVERQLNIAIYERVGIRFVYYAPAPDTVHSLAAALLGWPQREGWRVSEFDFRAETQRNSWEVALRGVPVFDLGSGRRYTGEVAIDVDQFRFQVPAREALAIDLGVSGRTAADLAQEFLKESGLWR